MADAIDVAVIGAGVIGAAVAERLARKGWSCFIFDRRPKVGGETTERNSGVVHAGLYYPPGFKKTRLCILGNRMLIEWAERASVPHARCGKVIVATTEAEEAALERLLAHGRSVGVEDLRLISKRELFSLEPNVMGKAALYSGTTGIVDPVELTKSLVASAESCGAEVVTSSGVKAIRAGIGAGTDGGYVIETTRGTIEARRIVNAAGLRSDEVAKLAGIDKYKIHPCKGDYFRLRSSVRYRHLVYPVKEKGSAGLGIHLTIDLDGRARLGPDAEYVLSKTDYGPPPEGKRKRFWEAARRLLEGVREDDLEYDSSGIRPKLRGPSEPEERDFVIAEDLPGFVNLIGIESPGVTSALAIADEVERMLHGENLA